MRRSLLWGAVVVFAAMMLGCEATSVPELEAPEVFTWGGQPVSLSIPPEGWRRERAQNGGEEGVRFVKTGSVGEEIRFSERFFLGNRDRCGRLQSLLKDLDNLDEREFAQRLQTARLYARPAFNDEEARLTGEANARLDDARTAFRGGDTAGARRAIAAALERANGIRYELDEVVSEVIFSAESLAFPGVKATSETPVPAELAGEAALRVDYALEYGGHVYAGKRLYVVKNNHLFEAGFQGLEENLPLFERIMDTVAFPPGQCEH